MGPEEWEFVPRDHGIPTAVAGFAPDSLLAALYSVLRQKLEGKCFLDNCYPQVVRPGGNATAKRYIDETMDIAAGNWRGIGPIAESAYVLKPAFAQHDSRVQLPSYTEMSRKRAGEMPPGCDCAKVVLGRIYPNECRLYGAGVHAASPDRPVHGFRRRRLPHLVGRWNSRKCLASAARQRSRRPEPHALRDALTGPDRPPSRGAFS